MIDTNEAEINHDVARYIQTVDCITINDKESYDDAGQALVELKLRQKIIKDFFKPLKEATHKAHKEVTTRENKSLSCIEPAERLIRCKRADYKAEQDRIHAAEQRKAEEEERKRVEDEQEKLMEEAANTKDIEAQEDLVMKAEEERPQPVFAPKVIKKTENISGGKTTWIKDISVEVQSIKLLCAGVANGKVPVSVVQFMPGKLKGWIKSMDIKPGTVPGLMIRETQRESVRV